MPNPRPTLAAVLNGPSLTLSLPDEGSLEEVSVEEEIGIVTVARTVGKVLAPVVVDAKSEERHRMGIPIALATAPLTVVLSQSPLTTES
jgi:hypothetical protein